MTTDAEALNRFNAMHSDACPLHVLSDRDKVTAQRFVDEHVIPAEQSKQAVDLDAAIKVLGLFGDMAATATRHMVRVTLDRRP